jgi:hypothetical protein
MTVKPPDSGGFFLWLRKGLRPRIAAPLQQDRHQPVTKNQVLGAPRPVSALSRVNGIISVWRKFSALIAPLGHDYCLFRPRADLNFTVARTW